MGIYEPKKIPNLSNTISIWREESKIIGIGELYIIACLNTYNFNEMKKIKLFEGVYEFSPRDSLQLLIKDSLLFLYSSDLYKNIYSIMFIMISIYLGAV